MSSTTIKVAPMEAFESNAQPSVRQGVLWTTAGMGVYSACQWLMVSVLAKLGTVELVGQYALGLAIAVPVLMLAQLNLRTVLATDANGQYEFRDYRDLRLITLVVATLGVAAFGWWRYGWSQSAAVIALIAVAQAIEWFSDTFQGYMQQHERMDRVAISYAGRGVLSVAALAAGLWGTNSLAVALAGVVAARLLMLAAFDAGFGLKGLERFSRTRISGLNQSRFPRMLQLFRIALPLGVVLVLVSYTTNVPRYFIAARWSNHELGIFSALASLITAGGLFVNAIGQAATPRLAKLFHQGDLAAFRRLTIQILAVGVALMGAAVAGSMIAGKFVLTLAYRPEYARYTNELTVILAAGSVGYLGSLLGYAITAARCFRPQIPLHAAVLSATALGAALLVPGHGLFGAAYAMAAGSLVQVAGELLILQWALKSRTQGSADV